MIRRMMLIAILTAALATPLSILGLARATAQESTGFCIDTETTDENMPPGTKRQMADSYQPDPDIAQPPDEPAAAIDAVTKWGRICIEPGVQVPAATADDPAPLWFYPNVYLVYVENGQIDVTVVASEGDLAKQYRGNAVVAEITDGTGTFYAQPGDIIALGAVEASFVNPSTTRPAWVFAVQVEESDPPSCISNCWLPSCFLIDSTNAKGCHEGDVAHASES